MCVMDKAEHLSDLDVIDCVNQRISSTYYVKFRCDRKLLMDGGFKETPTSISSMNRNVIFRTTIAKQICVYYVIKYLQQQRLQRRHIGIRMYTHVFMNIHIHA